MKRYRMEKLIGLICAALLGMILIFMVFQGVRHGQTAVRHAPHITVDETRDLNHMRTWTEDQLSDAGFTAREIEAIRKVPADHAALDDWLKLLIEQPGSMEQVKIIEHIPFTGRSQEESDEDDPFVEISIEPMEAVHLVDREAHALKLYYTVKVKEPFYFQRQDFFQMVFNEWDPLFRYAVLHYVSPSGKTYEEYLAGEPLMYGFSASDFTLAYKVNKRIDGERFYLAGISGMLVLESSPRRDLSTYAEYQHQRLSGFKAEGAHSDWNFDFSQD